MRNLNDTKYLEYIWRMYAPIYSKCEVTGINQATRSAEHIFNILLNKYGYYILKIAHPANILHGHVDPQFLLIYAQKKPSDWDLYFTHYIQICFRKKLAYQIEHICQILDVHTWGMYVQKYATYKDCTLKALFHTKWYRCTNHIWWLQ